jgi:hypothetical protein
MIKLKSTDVYRVIRGVIGPWCKQNGFRNGPAVCFATSGRKILGSSPSGSSAARMGGMPSRARSWSSRFNFPDQIAPECSVKWSEFVLELLPKVLARLTA